MAFKLLYEKETNDYAIPSIPSIALVQVDVRANHKSLVSVSLKHKTSKISGLRGEYPVFDSFFTEHVHGSY